MALRTSLTDLMVIEHPIVLAPMGGSAGGALAAAVSNGGGLGMLGGGRGEWSWLEPQLAIVAERTDRPWGVGFLSWSADVSVVEQALDYRPHAVMLSFGDPRPLAGPVRDAGLPLIVQVTDLEEAVQALELGADVLVAQGSEAGGHGGRRATLPFVPTVVDLATPTPVLAAGGIADGRGIAAALVLGAAGALIGTRFQATPESLIAPEVAKAIIDGQGEQTERSRVLDIARGAPWPSALHGSCLAQCLPGAVARSGSRVGSRRERQSRIPHRSRTGGPVRHSRLGGRSHRPDHQPHPSRRPGRHSRC